MDQLSPMIVAPNSKQRSPTSYYLGIIVSRKSKAFGSLAWPTPYPKSEGEGGLVNHRIPGEQYFECTTYGVWFVYTLGCTLFYQS